MVFGCITVSNFGGLVKKKADGIRKAEKYGQILNHHQLFLDAT